MIKVMYPKGYKNSSKSCTFLFLGRLGSQSITKIFCNLKVFFHILMDKTSTKLYFLYIAKFCRVRKKSNFCKGEKTGKNNLNHTKLILRARA